MKFEDAKNLYLSLSHLILFLSPKEVENNLEWTLENITEDEQIPNIWVTYNQATDDKFYFTFTNLRSGEYRFTIQKKDNKDAPIIHEFLLLNNPSIVLVPSPASINIGGVVSFEAIPSENLDVLIKKGFGFKWDTKNLRNFETHGNTAEWNTKDTKEGVYLVKAMLVKDANILAEDRATIEILPMPLQSGDNLSVTLNRTHTSKTDDQALWVIIRNRTLKFNQYKKYIDDIMCCKPLEDKIYKKKERKGKDFNIRLPFPSVDAYNLLKVATELFIMQECGTMIPNSIDPHEESIRIGRDVSIQDIQHMRDDYLKILEGEGVLPIYFHIIRNRLKELPLKTGDMLPSGDCYGILKSKLTDPCLIELIWSYWHEEGMLVNTLNAISRRFQNIHDGRGRDPLASLEIDPLRPLNNILWGYIQDEQHRLNVKRRIYEYEHHYGLKLDGQAPQYLQSADRRSKFLEAFNHLMYLCSIFFKQDDDTTVIADGFPVLNGLREVHFLLSEGAHNQFGDLPSTARQEMLIEQWILSRPEIREFLRGRIMVPYPEEWMDCVDTMKTLQGWVDVSAREFSDLATFGEQLLLSIRYGAWSIVNFPPQAANWARYWRSEIQRYTHAYRAVTGVDLTSKDRGPQHVIQPSIHLRNRLAAQMQRR
ncbi:MAG: hypothetical protein HZB59_11185 [Ignavibacteriales bacterium]|nr:hypothetical protein [Ignavibacteriales bacterium]